MSSNYGIQQNDTIFVINISTELQYLIFLVILTQNEQNFSS
jgi:hypothetical protein